MVSTQLDQRIKEALLAKDQVASSTLRLLKSELKNAAIAKGGELTEQEELQMVRRELKKRQDAIALYAEKAPERVAVEEAEAAILEQFLPTAPSQELIEAYVKELVASGAAPITDMGGLIRLTVAHFAGAADGKSVSQAVKAVQDAPQA